MTVSVISGTNNKPVASARLRAAITSCEDLVGTLFIGYPIVYTTDGPLHIDALYVSPQSGAVVFDLVEAGPVGDHETRQDQTANALELRLREDRRLIERRSLRIPIRTITFMATTCDQDLSADPDYPITDATSLVAVLRRCPWSNDKASLVYRAALSALQNVASVRKPRTNRTIVKQNSRGARLKRLEDSIATLDEDQSRAVIETVSNVQRIRGLAGSGKTIVLALKAAYLHAQHPQWRIAVTFNTRALKGHFRRLITNFVISQKREEPDWQRLRIVNAWGAPGPAHRHGIYSEFCSLNDLEYFDYMAARQNFVDPVFGAVCSRALQQARAKGGCKVLYDAILVDEAQDLPEAFLRLCYASLPDSARRLTYAYDELQNLVSTPVSPPEQLFGKKADGTPVVRFTYGEAEEGLQDVILSKCYRNSRPVLVCAHALGFGIYRKRTTPDDPGIVQMFENRQLWEDIGYRLQKGSLRGGRRVSLIRPDDTSPRFLEQHSNLNDLVQFVHLNTEEEQVAWIVEEIRRNVTRDELRHDDIIVINSNPLTTRRATSPIRALLLQKKISSHVAGVDTGPDEFFMEKSESITFSGVHRAKGNEAGMVYVINAQDCFGGERHTAGRRNRLFVGITRSKGWVRVVGIGDNMRRLIAEYEDLKGHDFALDFIYPTDAQRKQMHIVHRDMTEAETARAADRSRELAQLVEDLETGRLYLSDLDAARVKKLRVLLDN